MKDQPALSLEACQGRQQRLLEVVRVRRLDGALITDPRHVHYFCGFWTPTIFPVALWIGRDGEVVLSAAVEPPAPVAATATRLYEAQRMGTLVEDLAGASLDPLQPQLRGAYFGCESFPPSLGSGAFEIIGPQIRALRRAKDTDEVGLIRHAIGAAGQLYQRARELAVPGANEVAVYAELNATAIAAAGEPIGELGNNFQSAASGAAPRDRAIEAGELWALDVAVVYRGYRCDLCRTLCVGGKPNAAQHRAHARVLEALHWFEANARAGSSGRELYQSVFARLDGYQGWSFPHHLGHGFGMSAHEAPRLNPGWDDSLQVGDVVAVEPGLYGSELREGVRLEDDFLVTETGLEKLSAVNLAL